MFAAIGLRPPAAQHSEAEGRMLRKYAEGRSSVVEIGVAEGGSAWELRQVIAPDGTLHLIDPYHLSDIGALSPARMTARRLVGSVRNGQVEWIERFSNEAVTTWTDPIDFLFIDGDHTFEGVSRDWEEWTPFLTADGHVALHDARTEADWTDPSDGPARLLERLRDDPGWEIVDGVDSLAVLARR
jgi:predicted O-methyltransferase YrrM